MGWPAMTSAAIIPSFVALWARYGGPTTSPIANTFGFDVRICRSTRTCPLGSTLIPALSGARPSVFARRPTDGLAPDKAGIKVDPKGHVLVDRQMRTSNPKVFAIGDVVGPPYLAHKATKEGMIAAEVIAGHPMEADYRALPAAIFTDPEIATVGWTEAQVREKGLPLVVGKVPFAAIGRALTA